MNQQVNIKYGQSHHPEDTHTHTHTLIHKVPHRKFPGHSHSEKKNVQLTASTHVILHKHIH